MTLDTIFLAFVGGIFGGLSARFYFMMKGKLRMKR